jgi:hypothetical protein
MDERAVQSVSDLTGEELELCERLIANRAERERLLDELIASTGASREDALQLVAAHELQQQMIERNEPAVDARLDGRFPASR